MKLTKMDEDITYCTNCHCMTRSIRKGRAKYVCGKCGHNKTLSDFYSYECEQRNKEGEKE